MGKKVRDEWKTEKENLENKQEGSWKREKIYKYTLENQVEIKSEIEDFLEVHIALKDELEEQLEELNENLKKWTHNGNQKLLYLKWIEEIGYELAYLVEFMCNNHFDYYSDLWVLKAPRGYWNSANEIIEIKSMDKIYTNNCINKLEILIKKINSDMADGILINKLAEVIEKYLIPLIENKANELKS